MKLFLALSTVLLLALGAPAAADWLVLQDGERIETRGGWEQKGSRVLYTSISGALVSLRASEVDFEASEAATNPPPPAPAIAAPRAPAPRRKPVLVLDNSSVPRAAAPSATPSTGSDTGEAAEESAESEALRVVSWEETTSSATDGLRFTGVIENTTDNFAVLVAIDMVVRGTAGSEDRARATMRASSVGPRESQTFEVVFPNVYAYSNVDFEISSKLLDSTPGQGPSTGGFNQPVETAPETPPSATSSYDSTPSAPEPPQG